MSEIAGMLSFGSTFLKIVGGAQLP